MRTLGRRTTSAAVVIVVALFFLVVWTYHLIRGPLTEAPALAAQYLTGLVYAGPGLIHAINRGLADLMRRDGLGSLAEAVGADQQV